MLRLRKDAGSDYASVVQGMSSSETSELERKWAKYVAITKGMDYFIHIPRKRSTKLALAVRAALRAGSIGRIVNAG